MKSFAVKQVRQQVNNNIDYHPCQVQDDNYLYYTIFKNSGSHRVKQVSP